MEEEVDTFIAHVLFTVIVILHQCGVKKKDLHRDEVLVHEDGRDAAELPQYVVVGPVQQHVQNPQPQPARRRQGPRGAVVKAAQPPGPVDESRDHVGVRLTHLCKMSTEYGQN